LLAVTMVSYEVTATVEPGLTEEYERFMRENHIPALIATGCFRSAALTRMAPGRYRMRYDADFRGDLDHYLATYAARFRAEFVARFPTGVILDREVGEVLQVWLGER
jgi:hypothetical protein